MGGWNIIYALINTAILGAIIYLLFGKSFLQKLKQYPKDIAGDLQTAEEAHVHAQAVSGEAEAMAAAAAEDAKNLLAQARQEAAENSGHAKLAAEQSAASYAQEKAGTAAAAFEKQLKEKLAAEAAAEISAAAAKKLQDGAKAEKLAVWNARFLECFRESFAFTTSDMLQLREGGGVTVMAETAQEPDAETLQTIEAIISAKAEGMQVQVAHTVKPELLGGMKLIVRDTVYDGSVLARLKQAETCLANEGKAGGSVAETLKTAVAGVQTATEIYQRGRVESLSDGICHVSGIGDAMAGEMILFPGGVTGMVLDLNQNDAGVVMLGDYERIMAGDEVRRSGKIIEVPVGEAMIGRVVNALGQPVDGAGPIQSAGSRPIECAAPGVIDRQPVKVPMQTGIKAIDALVPIGRGQRELVIGDRQTGKSAIALDTIINQRGKNMICIYVAIGQKESTVAGVVDKLKSHGAMDYTIVVCANASEASPMLYIAPYAGAAMGEYFMYKGKDVLIIYDDLSKHAVAYREISLLLHRPPGREAYPGDVFYLHSRLLERAARLSDALGGGSMTALPFVETQAGDFSAYIPTNVISITDGQIYLESELFNAGVRPALNAGLSVSRVGGSAQLKAMKQVAGQLRVELAQYRELAAFSQFGSDLDKATRNTLHRGERMTEVLKQPRYAPMRVSEQIISIYAVSKGYADDLELNEIAGFESGLIAYVNAQWPEFDALVMANKPLSKDDLAKLNAEIEAYKQQ